MSEFPQAPVEALTSSMRDFRMPHGADLLARSEQFYEWQNLRRQNGLWPFSRATDFGPRTEVMAADDRGNVMEGVNFASQDYLSLSAHPAIVDTAIEALKRYGAHSAGSPALVGNTTHSVALEKKIAEFLHMPECALYPTGWAAGYGAIKGFVRSYDHIVMDMLSHVCLQEGANAATRNIRQFRHLDVEHCRKQLAAIRAKDTQNGIMVIVESLFSMDSDVPDLRAFQALAHEYGATLLVDVAHDLGALGPQGRGFIGKQGMLGQIDVVMGSFSKTFASNGGFVCVKNRALKEYLRFFSPSTTFSNALSPAQAATVLKAFEIVESAEGESLRGDLMRNVLALRGALDEAGLGYYGEPSAIVCVKTGAEGLARLVSRRLPALGLLANLVEYPAVPKGAARFRMQVMARHTQAHIARAVGIIAQAKAAAQEEFVAHGAPQAEPEPEPGDLAAA
jgi:7-keto-8-aminopelargonate synthetase-like enzyme